jgi:S-adenosylmethionine:tRNA-ribosyltransferase-isomerase (queuine synthetase)
VFIRQRPPERIDAFLTPVRDDVIVLTVANGRAHNQKQNLAERVTHPPGIAQILNCTKVIKKRLQARRFKPFNHVHAYERPTN